MVPVSMQFEFDFYIKFLQQRNVNAITEIIQYKVLKNKRAFLVALDHVYYACIMINIT